LSLCQDLFQLTSDRPESWMILGEAHVRAMQPASAQRIYRQFLERWPEHEFAEAARGLIQRTEALIRTAEHLAGVAESPELYELAEAHEQVVADLYLDQPARAARRAEALLERWPDFIPARNNLIESCYHLGQMDRALELARGTVELVPENMYAEACLCRLLAHAGRRAEAEVRCSNLAKLPVGSMDHLIAAVEACSLLARHEQVLALIERGGEYVHLGDPIFRARLHHLAAVAAARLGRRPQARDSWQQSLRLDPSNAIVTQNYADFRKPSTQQHGAWAFEVDRWLAPDVLKRIREIAQSSAGEGVYCVRMRGLMRERPELVVAFEAMLLNAGPDACRLLFSLARTISGGPLTEPLYAFACGQRGSEEFRLRVLDWLRANDLVRNDDNGRV
jgi:tetratricopeptide (TPR) repeat protein